MKEIFKDKDLIKQRKKLKQNEIKQLSFRIKSKMRKHEE